MRLQPVQDPLQQPTGAVRLDGSTSWLERQTGRELAYAGYAGAATLGRWSKDLGRMEAPALLLGVVEIVKNPGELEIAYVDTEPTEALVLKLPDLSAAARGVRMGPTGQLHLFDAKRRQLAA